MDQGDPHPTIITRLANMSLTAPGFLEQRFHADVRLDPEGFAENREARATLCGYEPYVMLSVFPKGIDFELRVAMSDHFAPERDQDALKALAVVALDPIAEVVTKLHFTHFPQRFPIRIFTEETEARAWLEEQREGRASDTGTQGGQ